MSKKLNIKKAFSKAMDQAENVLPEQKCVKPVRLGHLFDACAKCNYIVCETFNFCPYCGTKIDWNND